MNLKGKSLLTLNDYSKEEIIYLLEVAKKLKSDKKLGFENQYLKGKNIALIFEKDSTRTRCSFEVASYDQGAHVTYLGSTGSQVGKKESIKDTARVLAGMYDGIEFRGYSQKAVEQLSVYSKLPVWNGLTDEDHPTQILADFLTILETTNKKLDEIKKLEWYHDVDCSKLLAKTILEHSEYGKVLETDVKDEQELMKEIINK